MPVYAYLIQGCIIHMYVKFQPSGILEDKFCPGRTTSNNKKMKITYQYEKSHQSNYCQQDCQYIASFYLSGSGSGFGSGSISGFWIPDFFMPMLVPWGALGQSIAGLLFSINFTGTHY